MAKTPKHCKELIKQYESTRDYCIKSINILKTVPKENIAQWLSNTNEEYFVGMIYGAIAMLETSLSKSNCYNGFSYVHEDGSFVSVDDVQSGNYIEWSRSYGIK